MPPRRAYLRRRRLTPERAPIFDLELVAGLPLSFVGRMSEREQDALLREAWEMRREALLGRHRPG